MKLTKLCLFLVALFVTVCLMGCGDDPIPEEPKTPTVREIAFFDFEKASWKTKQYAPEGDGATVETAEGAGIDGSNCILVSQTDTYGEVIIDYQEFLFHELMKTMIIIYMF